MRVGAQFIAPSLFHWTHAYIFVINILKRQFKTSYFQAKTRTVYAEHFVKPLPGLFQNAPHFI